MIGNKKIERNDKDDKVVVFDGYGKDYTLKVIKTPGKMFYSTAVYENDEIAECIFYGPVMDSWTKAKQAAIAAIKKDEKKRRVSVMDDSDLLIN